MSTIEDIALRMEQVEILLGVLIEYGNDMTRNVVESILHTTLDIVSEEVKAAKELITISTNK
ncbi:hypothetical protein Dred_2580 [Desulforamulus reducens MI-1]|uniref:Uncharacterized protein n=1 Tax=Desulforamulus reducens (strain ATCC BAA-1160 / DSM 100696 / MI-1) TaxID=349161 RepID=A4J7N7_DESRM|nr:hypothetical protein [Desulforamulus reducens]ABO51090.1 hypothetical protein Dred_2580 [Desulforamulus reducens MI-1]